MEFCVEIPFPNLAKAHEEASKDLTVTESGDLNNRDLMVYMVEQAIRKSSGANMALLLNATIDSDDSIASVRILIEDSRADIHKIMGALVNQKYAPYGYNIVLLEEDYDTYGEDYDTYGEDYDTYGEDYSYNEDSYAYANNEVYSEDSYAYGEDVSYACDAVEEIQFGSFPASDSDGDEELIPPATDSKKDTGDDMETRFGSFPKGFFPLPEEKEIQFGSFPKGFFPLPMCLVKDLGL